MRSMKILHTADIHLAPRLEYIEDAGRRAQRREDVAAQADAIPRLAREHGVDAVVIAGDAFDRDLPAQAEVARLARALADAAVPVLVAPGTHDPWRPGGVWDRDWPANVTIFRRDEWETVRVGEAAFHGIATTGRPRVLFDGLPTDPDARFQVGVAHASMLWADVKEKVDRKNYPFEEADLDATALNYLALGDHHRMRVARRGVRAAAYPGSPEGIALDPAEAGDRFMLVVTLTDPASPPTIEPVKVDRREVYLEELDLGDLQHEHPADVDEEVRRRIAAAASPDRLARFDLTGVLHHALSLDVSALAEDDGGYFLLQVRDRTRTVPAPPADLPTIRAAFERRLAERLATAASDSDREIAQRALALGVQALEGLPL
ncbi:MAG: hypothetical protein E6I63_00910 [Chloroflexi bacterium]|nr:MAG: hypothetical protein E6I63_00910 [Chloroflexota bacterium]